MIVIQLKGGLGNQMFQYAAAKALSIKNNCSIKIDLSFLENTRSFVTETFTPREFELNIFHKINTEFITTKEKNKFFKESRLNNLKMKLGITYFKKYDEISLKYFDDYFHLKQPIFLNGYFASEKYFKQVESIIYQEYQFPSLMNDNANYAFELSIKNNTSISVHVRRGDYLKPKVLNFHGICDIIYYRNAIDMMKKIFPDSVLYFFSDDINWVNEHLLSLYPHSFLVNANSGKQSWKDMYLMSCCNHHIIANSSFSWWAAWLNKKTDKKVIAPKQWFADTILNDQTVDFVPKQWIRI